MSKNCINKRERLMEDPFLCPLHHFLFVNFRLTFYFGLKLVQTQAECQQLFTIQKGDNYSLVETKKKLFTLYFFCKLIFTI